MKKIRLYLSTLLILLALGASSLEGQNTKKTLSKDEAYRQIMELTGASLSILDRYYVDSVDMTKIGRRAIDALLQSLDPYTEFYSEEDMERLRILTTGEYGGIGAVIQQRPDSTVVISEPMEGMPAVLAGLKAGDKILEIDGKDFRKSTVDKVTAALKGQPNTKLTILIQRLGEATPRKVEFQRKKIVMNPVPFFGLTKDGFGYISLTSFPNTAAEEVRKALLTLTEQHKIKGLILDLRSNGGGLLEEAVKIVNLFVPAGKVVVTTKGRAGRLQDETLRTQNAPVAPNLPLAILINEYSASAAEIVSGALQDMDRAVVLGEQSFGKGLVQSTLELPYNSMIKLTTAKYYIPSGRCIQKLDYHDVQNGKQAKVIPDSLIRVFHTEVGRPVKDAGGILPDIEVKEDSLPTILYYLSNNNDTFDWITRYVQTHKNVAPASTFSLTDADYADFSKMLLASKFDYDRQSGKALGTLENIAKVEGYYNKSKALLDSLKTLLEPDLKYDLEHLKPQIIDQLNKQIILRYYYRRGLIERNILSEKEVLEAEKILGNPNRYREILTSVPSKSK